MTGPGTARAGAGPLAVVGDALLDVDLDGRVERLSPEAPVPVVDEPVERSRPGGAALAAALAAGDAGREVVLVTALGDDARGRHLRALLEAAGVTVLDLGLDSETPAKIRVRCDGRTLLRLDQGGSPGRPGPLPAAAGRALDAAAGVLVADYGRGVTAAVPVRQALARLRPRVPVVWDPHPRGAPPLPGAWLVTPNQAEAAGFASELPDLTVPPVAADGLALVAAQGRALRDGWQVASVAITLGRRGALLVQGSGAPLVVPAPPAPPGDACGAGDRFASAAARLLTEGALISEAVIGAVAAASSFVARGGAAALDLDGRERRAGEGARPPDRPPGGRDVAHARAVASAVRDRGGTVVTTGGCFDLLHAGHVATLRAARRLGDCLIVCLNADASVRRLKGPGRPLVGEADRAAVLEALDCVDAVVVFDEPTPEAVLEALRPDVFAKGGDYALADLPEAALLARWGGQAVILPYLQGRSTTRLLEEASRRGDPANRGGSGDRSDGDRPGRPPDRVAGPVLTGPVPTRPQPGVRPDPGDGG